MYVCNILLKKCVAPSRMGYWDAAHLDHVEGHPFIYCFS